MRAPSLFGFAAQYLPYLGNDPYRVSSGKHIRAFFHRYRALRIFTNRDAWHTLGCGFLLKSATVRQYYSRVLPQIEESHIGLRSYHCNVWPQINAEFLKIPASARMHRENQWQFV